MGRKGRSCRLPLARLWGDARQLAVSERAQGAVGKAVFPGLFGLPLADNALVLATVYLQAKCQQLLVSCMPKMNASKTILSSVLMERQRLLLKQ